mmetsp:Transcript_9090/g.16481  ORF Transcript_9090/g.16481 Transcript_9090/m.16481 type:complete len:93 (-) Transcript_9090:364-642(-)
MVFLTYKRSFHFQEINYNIFHPPSSYYSYYSFEPISISFDSEIIDVGFWKQIVGGNGRDGGGKGSFERGTVSGLLKRTTYDDHVTHMERKCE